MTQDQLTWFCKIDGAVLGPITTEQLRQLARKGRLKRDDLVRSSDRDNWVRAGAVNGLFDDMWPGLATEVSRPATEDEAGGPPKTSVATDKASTRRPPLPPTRTGGKAAAVGKPTANPWANPAHHISLAVRSNKKKANLALIREDGQPVVIARRVGRRFVISRRERGEFGSWISFEENTSVDSQGSEPELRLRVLNSTGDQIGEIGDGELRIRGKLIAQFEEPQEQQEQSSESGGELQAARLIVRCALMVYVFSRMVMGSDSDAIDEFVAKSFNSGYGVAAILFVLGWIALEVGTLMKRLAAPTTKPSRISFKLKSTDQVVAAFRSNRIGNVVDDRLEIEAGCPHVSLVLLLTLLHTFSAPFGNRVKPSRETEYAFEVGGEVAL